MTGLIGDPSAWGDPRSQGMGLIHLAQAISPRNRFVGGLLNYGQQVSGAQDADMKRKAFQMQIEANQLNLERARREAEIEQQMQQAARSSVISPERANAMSMGPMPDGSVVPQVQPGFNQRGFLDQLYGINPFKAMEVERSMSKDNSPLTVAPGASLVDRNTLKPVFTAPKEEAAPAAIKEYQFAVGQGYKGTFDQWDKDRRRAGASSVSVNTGQKGLDNELKIRSDFRSEPIYKAHNEVHSAHSQITAALKQQSPAGDLAGATKIMKILDPGSVVRESELGMAMAATGALDRLYNYAGMVVNGTKLTPKQRADFQTLADKLYAESAKQYNAKRGEYAGFATDYNLNANRIVGPAITSPRLPVPQGAPTAPTAPAGRARFLGFE